MIGRISKRVTEKAEPELRGFDDFELRLGDVLRGERATLGKSLLDVQRELRIKAAYIAAIENCDPSAFDTPGFIAGYVRSYARYLGLDPDQTYEVFCAESGFSNKGGLSERTPETKRAAIVAPAHSGRDPFANPRLPFVPSGDGFLSRIEPGAIGSTLVLIALIGGVGYGGWSVLQQIQQVQMAPVDQTPVVLSDLDPLNDVQSLNAEVASTGTGVFDPPSQDVYDRLYRPEALDVPVLIARDAPISTLDPAAVGAFARLAEKELPQVELESAPFQVADVEVPVDPIQAALAEALGQTEGLPQVLEPLGPGVTVVAARQSWVRVQDASGTTLFEAIMQSGDTFEVPQLENAPNIRVGESGAIYFAVNGMTYGPAGQRGAVTRNLALSADTLTSAYEVADITQDGDLERVIVELNEALLNNPAQ